MGPGVLLPLPLLTGREKDGPGAGWGRSHAEERRDLSLVPTSGL
jgi:hypothetical protein